MIAVLSGVLFGFACLCLVLHICACLIVAARRLRREGNIKEGAGVTLLIPLEQTAPELLEQCLKSAFAESYPHKEIIFCAGILDKESHKIIRAIRETNAAVPSLLIAAREGEAAGEADSDSSENPAKENLAKGWKAARYDRVVTALPNAVLPADYIARFISRDKQERKKTGLVFAPLWAINPRGLRRRLMALLMNRQARRAALADSLGKAIAENSVGLWHYELLNNAGGIDAFMAKAETEGRARAATELARKQEFKIHLTARPVSYDLRTEQANERRGVLRAQIGSLRCSRHFLPALFYGELLLNIVLPAIACAAACFLHGGFAWAVFIAFLLIWYGAEIAFCSIWGAGCIGGLKIYALLPLRDILALFLWLRALANK